MTEVRHRRGRRAWLSTSVPERRITEQAISDARHVSAASRLRAVLYIRVSTEDQAQHGYSLPEQEEAGVQYIRDHGYELVDIYIDHDSAYNNSGDRPRFKAMLARVTEQRDVDVVVVKKLDRFARDAALHMATRKALTKVGVRFECIEQKIDESPSGWLSESVQAVINEWFSRNLSVTVKDGMRKKAALGGALCLAPIGYLNQHQMVEGRRVASIVFDPDRADLVRLAFRLYATGEYTVEQLADEMRVRGLRTRDRAKTPSRPLRVGGLAWVLGNPFYIGVFIWNGVQYTGRHPALIDGETFDRVQRILASRSQRGIRERRHNHYLKGVLACGVCGRKLSVNVAKGHTYFYCLGQKDPRKPSGCREAYVRAEKLEQEVEALYQRVQIPRELADRFRARAEAEMVKHMAEHAAQREFQTKRLAKLEQQRRLSMDAYYRNAIDVEMLRAEQERIGAEVKDCERLLAGVVASMERWQRVLTLVLRFATDCAATYRRADARRRAGYNSVVFDALLVRDGGIAEPRFAEPFGGVFSLPTLEYDDLATPIGFEPTISTLTGWRVRPGYTTGPRDPGMIAPAPAAARRLR
jgi:site-specific DNA recombinase